MGRRDLVDPERAGIVAGRSPPTSARGYIVEAVEPEQVRLDGEDYERWWIETGEGELRQVLHWKWDPIGVASVFPWAADEYDRYAPQIAAAMKEDATAEAVDAALWRIETERMGVTNIAAAAKERRAAAEAIVRWHQNSQGRWRRFGTRLC